MPTDTQGHVHDLLGRMSTEGLPAAKQLFWTELNYDHANEPLSDRQWPENARDILYEPPLLLAQHESEFGSFDIVYAKLGAEQRGRTFPLSVGAERQVINQLLNDHPYALFLFSNPAETHWHLVNVRYDEDAAARRVFRRIAVGPHERLRTAAERVAMLDVASLAPDLFGLSPLAIQQRHDEAFDVEAVTKAFFATYRRIFEHVEGELIGPLDDGSRRSFTQRLFNRLLFIVFLERKGWLSFDGEHEYLRAMWDDHRAEVGRGEPVNFYRDRLYHLFFSGLNAPGEVDVIGINRGGFLGERIGQVPYLNGGLFEKEELDHEGRVTVPDEVWQSTLDDLLYHYNFTVTESTPLDIEVAVDPEMLGRIFEELVTGRHESGSYYTPKPIVAFMGQEALKGYLETACPEEGQDVIASFVEGRDPSRIRDPEAVLTGLRTVKVCDPACGSGAYLVGMLHELLDLRAALFATRKADAPTVYERKLEIIQHNLYGVDIDPFAVNIARLRLWLSLIVDFEGAVPPPLPNLDFKIEVGDSLTGPDPSGGLQPDLFRQQQIDTFFRLRGEYLQAHGGEKRALRVQIDALRAEIAEWAHPNGAPTEGFDWAVEFAEVFCPHLAEATMLGAMSGVVNEVPGQMELVAQDAAGFDIALANPPYVRQELIREYKPVLRELYPEVYSGVADLYVYFYARGLQLLKAQGMFVFISSNKFMRAGYGEGLRSLLVEKTTLRAVIDFGDLPLFEATTYPMVLVTRKWPAGKDHTFEALNVEDLQLVDSLPDAVRDHGWSQTQRSLGADGWTLQSPEVLRLMHKLRASGVPLSEYVDEQFRMGIKTGLNRAFVIDQETRDRIVAEDPESLRIITPWLRGRDVKRWHVECGCEYLIAIRNSDDEGTQNPWADARTEGEARRVFQQAYPAVYSHLGQYEDSLKDRSDQGKYWWELRACAYYAKFAEPKILYPDIAKRCEFAFDGDGYLTGNTTYFVAVGDLVLLGLLNSKVVDFYYRHVSAMIQRDYLRFFIQYLREVPIPRVVDSQRIEIESLVRKLVHAEGRGPHVEEWEEELNRVVYSACGLTEAEIAVVERIAN